MTSPDKSHHVEVKDGDHTVAAAEVTAADSAGGTVRASLLPSSGPTPPGTRASLVDAVLDLPEVQASSRRRQPSRSATPGSLQRLRERTEEATAPARPGRPSWWMRTYRPAARRPQPGTRRPGTRLLIAGW